MTLSECFEQFTREEVLDGDERPVSSLTCMDRNVHALVYVSTLYRLDVSAGMCQLSKVSAVYKAYDHSEIPSCPCFE